MSIDFLLPPALEAALRERAASTIPNTGLVIPWGDDRLGARVDLTWDVGGFLSDEGRPVKLSEGAQGTTVFNPLHVAASTGSAPGAAPTGVIKVPLATSVGATKKPLWRLVIGLGTSGDQTGLAVVPQTVPQGKKWVLHRPHVEVQVPKSLKDKWTSGWQWVLWTTGPRKMMAGAVTASNRDNIAGYGLSTIVRSPGDGVLFGAIRTGPNSDTDEMWLLPGSSDSFSILSHVEKADDPSAQKYNFLILYARVSINNLPNAPLFRLRLPYTEIDE